MIVLRGPLLASMAVFRPAYIPLVLVYEKRDVDFSGLVRLLSRDGCARSRSEIYLIGQTSAQIVRAKEQLSFLYKTSPS